MRGLLAGKSFTDPRLPASPRLSCASRLLPEQRSLNACLVVAAFFHWAQERARRNVFGAGMAPALLNFRGMNQSARLQKPRQLYVVHGDGVCPPCWRG